jgi:hypothetical protein
VHFSNDAVETLYAAWIGRAAGRRGEAGMAELEAFLQQLLDSEGPGCRGFGCSGEYLPEEIARPDVLGALAGLIRETIEDPAILPGIAGDAELRRSWNERLEQMLASIDEEGGATSPDGNDESPTER